MVTIQDESAIEYLEGIIGELEEAVDDRNLRLCREILSDYRDGVKPHYGISSLSAREWWLTKREKAIRQVYPGVL